MFYYFRPQVDFTGPVFSYRMESATSLVFWDPRAAPAPGAGLEVDMSRNGASCIAVKSRWRDKSVSELGDMSRRQTNAVSATLWACGQFNFLNLFWTPTEFLFIV